MVGRNPEPALVYADSNTYSGPDEDPTFDSDDELVFMARHMSTNKATLIKNGWIPFLTHSYPENVQQDLFAEVTIIDPLDKDRTRGYVYLFKSSLDSNNQPMLRQDAAQKLVHYDFDLTKGEYKANYQFQCTGFVTEIEPGHLCSDTNMNPEDSWVKTAHYSQHFAENW